MKRGVGDLSLKKVQWGHNSTVISSLLLLVALVLHPLGWAFFDDEIPTQKMVLSRQHAHKAHGSDAGASSKQAATQVKEQDHKSEALSQERRLDEQSTYMTVKNQDDVSVQGRPEAMPAANATTRIVPPPSAVPNGLHTDFGRMSVPEAPYDIVPEQGQPMAKVAKDFDGGKNKRNPEKNNEPYAFGRVMQWVNEVAMVMFTYSGEHLDRDKKNVAQYFSPEAWQTVDQFLFDHKDSPFLQLKKHSGTSKGMSLDWPKTLRSDIGKRGRIWWLKIPVSVVVKEKNRSHRVLYEVKLGVMPVMREGVSQFLAEEVMIKKVEVKKSRRFRRR